jgi:hypothetical protein
MKTAKPENDSRTAGSDQNSHMPYWGVTIGHTCFMIQQSFVEVKILFGSLVGFGAADDFSEY